MTAAEPAAAAVVRVGDTASDAGQPAVSPGDGLRTDVVLVALVATAPVLLEWAAGYVRGGSDLGRLFQPLWAWWFERPRVLDGWNPWVFGGFGSGSDPQLAALHPLSLLYAALSGTSERSAPGWTASVDGAATPVLLANGAFRAVRVPAGDHDVRFAYRPRRTRAGLALAVAGVGAALLLAARGRAQAGPERR